MTKIPTTQNLLKPLFSEILAWIYPPLCSACKMIIPIQERFHREIYLCETCALLLEPIGGIICTVCGKPRETVTSLDKTMLSGDDAMNGTACCEDDYVCKDCRARHHHFAANRAAFIYDGILKDMMHDMKFRARRTVAEGLGRYWAHLIVQEKVSLPCTITDSCVLVPLPMHVQKVKQRGYNQAEILSLQLSKHLGIPTQEVLFRIKNTAPQSGLHPAARAENVNGVFKINPKTFDASKQYIIIDDIYTTGASLNECAKTLKNAGAANIYCMTTAITVKFNKGILL